MKKSCAIGIILCALALSPACSLKVIVPEANPVTTKATVSTTLSPIEMPVTSLTTVYITEVAPTITETTTTIITQIEAVMPSPEEVHWQKCLEEYPMASEVWLAMKSYGWSDAACAGLMGNFMREVGGAEEKINGKWVDTLHIDPYQYGIGQKYYGLCQWSFLYYPDIFPTKLGYTPSVIEQLEYLRETLATRNYGFNEEYLCTATDYKEVAKIFFEKYERANDDVTRRERNAEKAYNYFVLDN